MQKRFKKIDLNNYTAIILTSRNSVDHFFRVADEMRFKVPEGLKYFCQSEAVAFICKNMLFTENVKFM
jgi:uroporphyrinogen-III synthase